MYNAIFYHVVAIAFFKSKVTSSQKSKVKSQKQYMSEFISIQRFSGQ
ncbi:hypothetical protein [Dapis sp. BLCC M229]